MSKIKDDLLKKISKKVSDTKERLEESYREKTVEECVFKFFKELEGLRAGNETMAYIGGLVHIQENILIDTLKKEFDRGVKVGFVYSEVGMIRGVNITWSNSYSNFKNIDKQRYIDVSEMLMHEIFNS